MPLDDGDGSARQQQRRPAAAQRVADGRRNARLKTAWRHKTTCDVTKRPVTSCDAVNAVKWLMHYWCKALFHHETVIYRRLTLCNDAMWRYVTLQKRNWTPWDAKRSMLWKPKVRMSTIRSNASFLSWGSFAQIKANWFVKVTKTPKEPIPKQMQGSSQLYKHESWHLRWPPQLGILQQLKSSFVASKRSSSSRNRSSRS